MEIILGILIPFIGTVFGSSIVFFMKNAFNISVEKFLAGLASGVMIAASIWSLIIPSIELAENQGIISWLPAALGFIIGVSFLIITDYLISKIQNKKKENRSLKNNTLLFLAVTLHNIPEGMAVGVAFAGVLAGNIGMTIAGAMSIALGIGIQNFPEGAIISMPLKSTGTRKNT